MKLETIALVIVCFGAFLWGIFMISAFIPALIQIPILWLIIVPAAAIGAYLLGRVIIDRISSKEDDYYDKLP